MALNWGLLCRLNGPHIFPEETGHLGSQHHNTGPEPAFLTYTTSHKTAFPPLLPVRPPSTRLVWVGEHSWPEEVTTAASACRRQKEENA